MDNICLWLSESNHHLCEQMEQKRIRLAIRREGIGRKWKRMETPLRHKLDEHFFFGKYYIKILKSHKTCETWSFALLEEVT